MTRASLLLHWGIALCLGAPAAVAAPASPPAAAVTPASVLGRVLQGEGRLVYSGELDANGESRIRVTHGPDHHQRQDWLAPPAMVGDVIIDNGAMRWHFSPQDAHADVSPSEQLPTSPAERQAMISRNYQLSLRPGPTIADQPTRLLILTPKAPQLVEHRLYVAEKGLAMRTELWRNGQMLDYAVFTRIDWQPTLTKTTFSPMLPPGAKVMPTIHVLGSGQSLAAVAAKLDFRPVLPKRLPSGFQTVAVRAFTTGQGSSPIAHWQLTDGMSSLSLFARKATAWRLPPDSQPVALPGGMQAARMDQGSSTMLIWQVGGVRYSLVGSIAAEALVDAAASSVLADRP
jgi:outer membrane lipoprotein-sorting protein